MSEKMLHKSMPGMLTDAGGIEGYASVYGNVDRGGDRVMPGAFGAKPFNIPLFAFHDEPVGNALCTPDKNGLHVQGTLANTDRAQEIRELMRVGAIPSMSFGYAVRKGEPNEHGGSDLFDVDTMEASVVPIPANPEARILAVKAFGSSAVLTADMDVKAGRRNSTSDQGYIQNAHDALVKAGAMCGDGDGKAVPILHVKQPQPMDADENPAKLAQAIDQMVDDALDAAAEGSNDEVEAILVGLAAVADSLLAVYGAPDADDIDEGANA